MERLYQANKHKVEDWQEWIRFENDEQTLHQTGSQFEPTTPLPSRETQEVVSSTNTSCESACTYTEQTQLPSTMIGLNNDPYQATSSAHLGRFQPSEKSSSYIDAYPYPQHVGADQAIVPWGRNLSPMATDTVQSPNDLCPALLQDFQSRNGYFVGQQQGQWAPAFHPTPPAHAYMPSVEDNTAAYETSCQGQTHQQVCQPLASGKPTSWASSASATGISTYHDTTSTRSRDARTSTGTTATAFTTIKSHTRPSSDYRFQYEQVAKGHYECRHGDCPSKETMYETMATLRQHMRLHLPKEAWPYVCDHQGCQMRYLSAGHLKTHKQSHSPPTHQCPNCRRMFKRKDGRVRHQRKGCRCSDRQAPHNDPPTVPERAASSYYSPDGLRSTVESTPFNLCPAPITSPSTGRVHLAPRAVVAVSVRQEDDPYVMSLSPPSSPTPVPRKDTAPVRPLDTSVTRASTWQNRHFP